MEELKEDLEPFEKAIKENAEAILIGHLVIPKETGKLPASLSKRFITKYIRKKYRYNGLIITDDIRMKAISFYLWRGINPIKLALNAGNDLIMLKYIGNEEKLIKNIIHEAKIGINLGKIDRKVCRILKAKEKYNVNNKEIELDYNFQDAINKDVEEIRLKCQMNNK